MPLVETAESFSEAVEHHADTLYDVYKHAYHKAHQHEPDYYEELADLHAEAQVAREISEIVNKANSLSDIAVHSSAQFDPKPPFKSVTTGRYRIQFKEEAGRIIVTGFRDNHWPKEMRKRRN